MVSVFRSIVGTSTLAASLLLAGCAGSSSTQFHRYTLPDESLSANVSTSSQEQLQPVAVPLVRLADYLSGDGIVMQTSDIEVQQAQGHLWAGNLARQLTRQLRRQLASGLGSAKVLDRPSGGSDTLSVQLDQFQGRHDGQAVVGGSYELRDGGDNIILKQDFHVTKPLQNDGYPALVRALAAGWQQVAGQMTQAIVAHSRPMASPAP
ncbi:PqiC family protein [Larsenimonas rhizosphaerae]|uniref:PqiC family protein n=1 Tax=Larsenimonas rhizosphaerae TaxID=2944682 RepID=UPI002033E116|nr:ABC-type transport auxiliary lipoprotein family protein [Larsenimonas rhizosphaerae]MCM2129293.1 ABC-type transport auxiliary lipoprotein family protein [Larsenimonas rhizosphaerae]